MDPGREWTDHVCYPSTGGKIKEKINVTKIKIIFKSKFSFCSKYFRLSVRILLNGLNVSLQTQVLPPS
jgi:hypothetical protein